MPNVRFLLKEPKSDKETLIYLFFAYHNLLFKYSTGLRISTKNWDVKKQRAKQTRAFAEHPEFNQVLDNLATATTRFYNECVIKKRLPLTDDIRQHLDLTETLRSKDLTVKPTLFMFIEQYINEQQSQTYGTKKTWVSCFNHLKEYAKIKKKALNFDNVDLDFRYDFEAFLYDKPREHSKNYAAKMLTILKQFLNAATERDYNQNLAFKSSRFTIKKEKVHDIYLSESEVKAMYDLDLSNKPKGYETVKDLFIIGCVTGLRFGDWHRVRKDQIQTIDGKDVLKIVTEKTGATVAFPLHRYIIEILDKYENTLPKPLTNQKTNEYLKEIGEWAGITQNTVMPTNKAGKRIDTEMSKFLHIGTHTARRSFATNAYLSKIDTISIMSITGHTTDREFLKYIKITAEQKAVKIADNAFFK